MGEQMDLNFQLFETAMLFITVIVVAFFLQVGKVTFKSGNGSIESRTDGSLYVHMQEGTSNYFKGLMLILCYLIVAASFFVHEDPQQG